MTNHKPLPPFLLNSVPKSGTHLMTQILLGIPHLSFSLKLQNYASHLDESFLKKLNPDQFARGHIFYEKSQEALLRTFNMKQIFVYRDPRDIIVSLAYYVDKVRDKDLYPILGGRPKKEQYLIAILGVNNKNFKYNNIAQRVNRYTGWIGKKNVLSVKYEDLVYSKQSFSAAAQSIVNFLYRESEPPKPKHEIIESMHRSINPDKSPTFRRGKIGDWRHEFDNEVKEAFKLVGGDLLIQLGYETDKNW